MIKKDHALLARRLLGEENDIFLSCHRRLFQFGCVEPDLNPLTYLRGSLRGRLLRGHNADNVQMHIRSCIDRLQSSDRQSAYWYFVLGTLMHYVADSFTYPHSSGFSGSLVKHRDYERSLHQVFESDVFSRVPESYAAPCSPWKIFSSRRRRYERIAGDMETDCQFITRTCLDILTSLLSGGMTSCITAI